MFDHANYDCYWMGTNRLWYIGDTCFSNRYETSKGWSNILCIINDDPWNVAVQRYVVSPESIKILAEKKFNNVAVRGDKMNPRLLYFISNGTKYPIQSYVRFMQIANDHNFPLEQVYVLDSIFLELLPTGGNA